MIRVRDATQNEADLLNAEDQKTLQEYFITEAKDFNKLYTTVFTIYTGLLVFFGLMSGEVLNLIAWPRVLVFLLPVLAWILGIYFFFQVLQPDIQNMPPNSPTAIRKSLTASNIKKAKYYSYGLAAFAIGVLLMLVSLGLGSYLASSPPPAAATGDVQLVIRDDSLQNIAQIPVSLVPGTNRTVVVSLRNTTDTSYTIRLDNGDTVDLDKTWVQTVIWKNKVRPPA
jgi:hypothetical protein